MASDNRFVVRVILIVLAIAILFVLITQYNKQSKVSKEQFTKPTPDQIESTPALFALDAPLVSQEQSSASDVKPSESVSTDSYRAVDFQTESTLPSSCFPRDKLTAEDLLPKDAANSKWAQVAPAGQGDVQNQNFLTAGYMVGIDTVGQTRRNANYQLRSDIPNPRFAVGPWNQSTIEFDTSRRFFEIGSEDC